MDKIKFVIVGSGWRSLYYVRIAKALPSQFELCAMLCRTEDKAKKMAGDYNIYTTTSIEECRKMNPDFAVVAVNKADIAKVSMEWMDYGITVLCETPAAQDAETLRKLWMLHKAGKKLVVAEQYTKYPMYDAMIKALGTGIIGEPDCINISLAHDYHASSLIRAFLNQKADVGFAVRAKTYEFPTVETLSRYERFTDGRISNKKRTVATFEFSDGKVAFYDFDSEQYRSPIRKNYVKVQGCRGEMKDDTFYYLDENYRDSVARLVTADRFISVEDDNPNLSNVREIVKIELCQNAKNSLMYEAVFGKCGLSQDETAIARIMAETAKYAKDENKEYMDIELRGALQDAYTAILLDKAVKCQDVITSETQPWQCE
ncbi:MAG: Gfo/Idh/MocA family oxidoreductase [Clostridia bacterium]|nr:Gfo/Idh/MocA family oxidoreductase [Clostridia bacterium]